MNAFVSSLLQGGLIGCLGLLGVQFLKGPTDRLAQRIAEKKVLLEVTVEDRKQAEVERKAEAEEKERLRKDYDAEHERFEKERARADMLYSELSETKLTLTRWQLRCARAGEPCKQLPMAKDGAEA